MPLHDALETLGGPAFRLVEDPLHRLVSFERCGSRRRISSNNRNSGPEVTPMEIVIGVILLIGAFALGHNTADQEAANARARLDASKRKRPSQDGFLSQDCRYRVYGPVQRDLTVPYSRQRRAERTGSDSTRVAYRGD